MLFAMPLLKYSFEMSLVALSKGSTATDRIACLRGPSGPSRPLPNIRKPSAIRTAAAPVNNPAIAGRSASFVYPAGGPFPEQPESLKTGTANFADQASGTSNLIAKLGWPLAIAMAFGAIAGALNTMYSSVASRTREIATLRAIGFGGFPAFVGTLVESLVLAAIGGIIGAAAAFLFFDGLSAATLGASFTQVVFQFALTPALVVNGLVLGMVIGLVGGLLPAMRAARIPIVAGLAER